MAEKLTGFDFDKSRLDSSYPYTKWFDGSIWKIRQGEDFQIPAKKMRTNLYSAAERRGCRVRTVLSGNEIVLQAYPWEDDDEA